MRYTTITLTSVTETVTGAVEFTFEPRRPLAHHAGQAGIVLVPGGGGRPFTLASDDRSGLISFATTLASGSSFKRALGGLQIGDQAHIAGPIGSAIPSDETAPVVAVCQGIGITPFLALARSRTLVDTTLLHVGTPHYFDEVAAAATVAEHLAHREDLQLAVAQLAAERPDARWSISGDGGFTASIAGQLSTLGVSSRRIHKDSFWTMKKSNATATAQLAPAAI